MGRMRLLIANEKTRSKLLAAKIDSNRFAVSIHDFAELPSAREFDLAIPITIPDVVALNNAWPDLNGTKFFAPTNETVFLAHNKIEFNRFLLNRGFGDFVPPIDAAEFPYVIKKSKDAGGENSFLVETESDESRYQDLVESQDYFRQQYVPGDTEYTTHIFATQHTIRTVTIRFRMNRSRYIRGVQMQPFKNVETDVVPCQFNDVFFEVLNELEYQGFGCFNYKLIANQPQIFEFNPRIGGSAHHGINELFGDVQPIREGLMPSEITAKVTTDFGNET